MIRVYVFVCDEMGRHVALTAFSVIRSNLMSKQL